MLELVTRLANGRKGARDTGEDGFTLIELMVVVLIIAILIAIAIPTFLGARQKAQDRAAQSNLRNALTAAKTAYVDSQDYSSDVTSGIYTSIEPSLHFASGPITNAGYISVKATVSDTLVLASRSAAGQCFYIKDVTGALGTSTAGTFYAKGAPPTPGTCDAADPIGQAASNSSW